MENQEAIQSDVIKHVTEAKLGHGFEFIGDKYGLDNLKKMMGGLREICL